MCVLMYCFAVSTLPYIIVLVDDLFLHVRLRLDFAIRMRIIMSTSTALLLLLSKYADRVC